MPEIVENKGFKKLTVYQKTKILVLEIYKITEKYPSNEQFVLVNQMRRAAISILANIVEGYAKKSSKEFARFLTISIGSLTELEVFLDLSCDLDYIDLTTLATINSLLQEVKRLLYGTRKSARLRF